MTEQANQRLVGIVTSQYRRLWSFVRRQVGSTADADDIVQEVFAELFEAYRLMKPIERMGAWLMRVARNRIIDRFRGRARAARVLAPGGEEALEEALALDLSALISGASGPEAQLQQSALAEALEEAIAALPAEQRAVFVAHELEGVSFKTLARQTGTPLNTLLGRKHAAVRRLRESLQTLYDDLEP